MKRSIFFSFLTLTALFIFSCQPPGANGEWPEDLEGKKSLLQQKLAGMKTLKAEIAQLEDEIASLDPNTVKTKKLVTAAPLQTKRFEHFVEIQGAVESDDVIMVGSETGGRILSIPVKEGQRVQKGALIARLDLETINKQIDEVETSLDLAQTTYERQKRLWDKNIGSEMQFLQAKANKERLEKSLETLEHQLTKANVYAPMSGVIESLMAEAGEVVSPGLPIVQLLNTRQVKVIANVPENYLQSVTKGEQVIVHFPALNEERKARISRVGSTIHPSNRTFEVEVEMNNQNGFLKPNLLATMSIKDYESKDAIAVPAELIQQEVSGRDFVFIKGKDDNGDFAQKVYVKTGLSSKNEIEILEGVEAGQIIIMEGARSLTDKEGIEVQLINNEVENG